MKFWDKFIAWQLADRKTASFFGISFVRMPVLLFWCWLFVWLPMTYYHLNNCDFVLHYAPHDFNINQKDIHHSQAIAAWGDSYIERGEEIPQWFGMEMGGTPRVGGLIDAREYCWAAFGFTQIRHHKLCNDLVLKYKPPRQIDKTFMSVVKLSAVSFLQMCVGMPVVLIVGMVGYGVSGFL
jgi:hypothetical protein